MPTYLLPLFEKGVPKESDILIITFRIPALIRKIRLDRIPLMFNEGGVKRPSVFPEVHCIPLHLYGNGHANKLKYIALTSDEFETTTDSAPSGDDIVDPDPKRENAHRKWTEDKKLQR